ncbi:MAG: class I SAM-dependent RNA methyltransferase, partial [Actinomycetota bacterium]|nr:class I SAM-dependent RNA methyltransferase [Actinomycetota bacterium]
RITSVESNPRATEHARHNLREWPGATAETGRVERWLRQRLATAGSAERERMRAATVVLDPPRAGAGQEVVGSLAELDPAQLIYVACDPVALARDTGLLAERGYELRTLRAFDLFPNTHHVEAVASFVRRG